MLQDKGERRAFWQGMWVGWALVVTVVALLLLCAFGCTRHTYAVVSTHAPLSNATVLSEQYRIESWGHISYEEQARAMTEIMGTGAALEAGAKKLGLLAE